MPQDNYYQSGQHRSERTSREGRGAAGRRDHAAQEEGRSAPRRPRKKRRSAGRTAALVLLYVTAVIGASILLACVGWVAAGDVLALNKEPKEVTFTVTAEDSFGDVASRLKKEGLIEYKLLFNLFASFTHAKEKIAAGTYTLNTDMDYRNAGQFRQPRPGAGKYPRGLYHRSDFPAFGGEGGGGLSRRPARGGRQP